MTHTVVGPGRLISESTTATATTYQFKYTDPGDPNATPPVPPEEKTISVTTEHDKIEGKMEKAYDGQDTTVVLTLDTNGKCVGISTTKP